MDIGIPDVIIWVNTVWVWIEGKTYKGFSCIWEQGTRLFFFKYMDLFFSYWIQEFTTHRALTHQFGLLLLGNSDNSQYLRNQGKITPQMFFLGLT